MIALHGFDWKVAEDGKSASILSEIEVKVGKVTAPYTIRYQVYSDGIVDMTADFTTGSSFDLPRPVLRMFLNPSSEQAEWYDHDPTENYRGQKSATHVGRYQTTVMDMTGHYACAQTMGGRTGTR